MRRADVVLALSLAVDLGMGRPLEHGMRSAILSVELARSMGLSAADAREAWYFVLLRLLGCTSDASELANLASGDELAAGSTLNQADWTSPLSSLGAMLSAVTRGRPAGEALRNVAHALSNIHLVAAVHLTHCEVATALAGELGLDAGVMVALAQGSEAWNGKGGPQHLKGDAIRPTVQLACLVEDFDTFVGNVGFDGAVALVKQRRGKIYGPVPLDAWLERAKGLYAALGDGPLWDQALAAEGDAQSSAQVPIDRQLEVLADFADLKASFTRGHSRAVASLAERAAAELGLSPAERVLCRRAGLAHDVGSAAVPAFIWNKPSPLSESESERVRLHAYYTQRVLARPQALAEVGTLAAQAHERVDGKGYPGRTQGAQLPIVARVVGAADVWHALVSDRPHRSALSLEAAQRTLKEEVDKGHLDADAVQAVLAAAGLAPKALPGELPSGLTAREVQVLRLLAVGKTNKEIAQALGSAPKTVDNQLQSVFKKLKVQTRAGATLTAMRAGLLA